MTDIAPVKGLIELTDNFTSELGLAEAALGNFTKTNQESLKAVSIAAGLVAGAITAIGVATIELGKRGSDVNDVNATLEHFAGGAKQAEDAMQALRDGTKGTVDNFILAKDAAHLLSAGVQLTAQDFGTLGQAAFVLQNRGLGGTKEQLELVSDALVTGRTRALAMAVGVVDAGDAEENYAKSLGTTADKLSDRGKVEAHRIEVMRILNAAVKDAGAQERDFGEEIEFAKTKLQNWVDDLGSAIASSEVFKQGFKAIETAVSAAFGDDKSESIQRIVHAIEQGAIKVLEFGQVAITMARVVEGAWEGIKTVILGTETVIVGIADGVVEAIAAVAKAGAALHIIPPEELQSIEDTRTNLRAMTADLAAQTVEAGKAVFGHTEFDKTLDGLSAGLTSVTNAMASATDTTTQNSEATNIAAANAKKLAATSKDLNAAMLDQTKIQAELVKSSTELAGIWDDYYKQIVKNSGTTRDAQIADIEATFNKQVQSLSALDPLYKEKYAAYEATAKASLDAISMDWDSVKDKSLEALQEQADKMRNTYEAMQTSGLHFTREVLDEQRKKMEDAALAARGLGKDYEAAMARGKAATEAANKALDETKKKADAAKAAMEAMVFKTDITKANFSQLHDANNPGTFMGQDKGAIWNLLVLGFSLQNAIAILQAHMDYKDWKGDRGPRVPGFRSGGMVDIVVGEDGPEAMRVPMGTQVFQNGTGPGGGGSITLNFHVNGTAVQAAQQIKDIIMRELMMRKQFSASTF